MKLLKSKTCLIFSWPESLSSGRRTKTRQVTNSKQRASNSQIKCFMTLVVWWRIEKLVARVGRSLVLNVNFIDRSRMRQKRLCYKHPLIYREAGDVWCLPPVWNLRAVIWFHFAISSLVLLPSPVTLSVISFSACWPFLLNFFQKILEYFSLRDRLFCMAPV